ncbi:MAG: AI-2E family transporter, partial [Rhodanobacteraceae bacterium]
MPPSLPPLKPRIIFRRRPPGAPPLLLRERRKQRASALERRRARRWRWLRLPLRILVLLAIGGTLIFASSLLIPLVLAAFIALGLNPIVHGLSRLHVPRGVGSVLVLLALIAVIGGGVTGLSTPAERWIQQAPRIGHEVAYKVERMMRPITRISHAASTSLASVGVGGAAPAAEKKSAAPGGFSLSDLLTMAPRALAATLTVILLVLFFLTYGDRMRARLVTASPTFSYRRTTARVVRNIQIEISRYLFTVTVINVCLGAATAAVLWALKMPDPLLWGGVATLFNYVPYVGATATTLLLLVVGLLNFSSPLHALGPAACFVCMGAMEGSVITPTIMGHRLRLSPVAVLVWLLIWGWMWGIPGVLLATPMLTCLKLITERLPEWRWFAKVVEGAPVETRPAATKPAETTPAESEPIETGPIETGPVETLTIETPVIETKVVE